MSTWQQTYIFVMRDNTGVFKRNLSELCISENKFRNELGVECDLAPLFQGTFYIGSENGNRVDISFEKNVVDAISVRFDMRYGIDFMFIDVVRSIGLKYGIYLADESGHPVSDIVSHLSDSDAAKFCANPESFLKRFPI